MSWGDSNFFSTKYIKNNGNWYSLSCCLVDNDTDEGGKWIWCHSFPWLISGQSLLSSSCSRISIIGVKRFMSISCLYNRPRNGAELFLTAFWLSYSFCPLHWDVIGGFRRGDDFSWLTLLVPKSTRIGPQSSAISWNFHLFFWKRSQLPISIYSWFPLVILIWTSPLRASEPSRTFWVMNNAFIQHPLSFLATEMCELWPQCTGLELLHDPEVLSVGLWKYPRKHPKSLLWIEHSGFICFNAMVMVIFSYASCIALELSISF